MSEHSPGPYRVVLDHGLATVTGKRGDVWVCNCGPENDSLAVADAERIKLTLTCHDPLLAACENLVRRLDAHFGTGGRASITGSYTSYDWKEQEAARAAIALAKKE